jgi:hypothetical protein
LQGSLQGVKPILALAVVVALIAPEAASGSSTLVSFTRSGGVAGSQLALRVTTDGRALVTANRRPRAFQLHATTTRRLRRLLADARFDRVDTGPSRCADCFVYSVRYGGRHVSYDDAQTRQVPGSVRAVVEELLRIARGGR